jgi:hypothetical protein
MQLPQFQPFLLRGLNIIIIAKEFVRCNNTNSAPGDGAADCSRNISRSGAE